MKSLKKISTIVLTLSLLFSTSLALSGTALAIDQSAATNDICAGIGTANGTGNNDCTNNSSGSSSIDNLVGTIVNVLSIIVGVVSVIMVIIGGFKYVVSNGDSNAANSARNTILYALIGLVIAALAPLLVHYVLGKVSS